MNINGYKWALRQFTFEASELRRKTFLFTLNTIDTCIIIRHCPMTIRLRVFTKFGLGIGEKLSIYIYYSHQHSSVDMLMQTTERFPV